MLLALVLLVAFRSIPIGVISLQLNLVTVVGGERERGVDLAEGLGDGVVVRFGARCPVGARHNPPIGG